MLSPHRGRVLHSYRQIAVRPFYCYSFTRFSCDSLRQTFLLPPDKKLKFKILTEEILSSRCLRFAGKVISLSLAIPGCTLYVGGNSKAISQLCRSSKLFVRVEGDLRTEVLCWRFLDDWKDYFPFCSEHHVTVSLFSDASTSCLWCGSVSRRTEVDVQRLLAL